MEATSSRPVIIRMGIRSPPGRLRISRQAENPSIRGIMTSSRMRSGRNLSKAAMPSSPSAASTVANPAFPREAEASSLVPESSSTTRISGGDGDPCLFMDSSMPPSRVSRRPGFRFFAPSRRILHLDGRQRLPDRPVFLLEPSQQGVPGSGHVPSPGHYLDLPAEFRKVDRTHVRSAGLQGMGGHPEGFPVSLLRGGGDPLHPFRGVGEVQG